MGVKGTVGDFHRSHSFDCKTMQKDSITSLLIKEDNGSGCGTVGRAVASNTRGPRFKSSHQENLYVPSTVLKRRK